MILAFSDPWKSHLLIPIYIFSTTVIGLVSLTAFGCMSSAAMAPVGIVIETPDSVCSTSTYLNWQVEKLKWV